MKQLNILNRYSILLAQDTWEATVKGKNDRIIPKDDIESRSYFQFLRKQALTTDVLLEAIALERVCKTLPKVKSVTEFFGGVGVSGTIVSDLLAPRKHTIVDMDEECVQHLSKQFPRAKVYQDDSLANWKKYVSEFCILDFNTFSLIHTVNYNSISGKTLTGLLNSPLPRWVVYCDTACMKLHLNHKVYSSALDQHIVTLDDYAQATANRWKTLGWEVAGWYHYGNSSLVFLAKDRPSNLEIQYLKRDSSVVEDLKDHRRRTAEVKALSDTKLRNQIQSTNDFSLIQEYIQRQERLHQTTVKQSQPRFAVMTVEELVAFANRDKIVKSDLAAAILELRDRILKLTITEQQLNRRRDYITAE